MAYQVGQHCDFGHISSLGAGWLICGQMPFKATRTSPPWQRTTYFRDLGRAPL